MIFRSFFSDFFASYDKNLQVTPKSLTLLFSCYKMHINYRKVGRKMNNLVSRILSFLTKQKVINQDEDTQAFYRYGIELCISSILNILLVLIIGVILNCILESIVFLVIFIFLRSFMGGYHASTYFRCNLLMCTSFTLLFLIYDKITLTNTFFFIISIIYIFVSTLIFCPVENPNKPIPPKKQGKLKILSIILCIAFFVLGVIFITNNIKLGEMVILTELLISCLVIIAKIKERSLKKNVKNYCKSD
ncbi:MAG: hypothetical protein E7509_04185 [Ruminococcus sp.]|nr:hypothetical protein [Ruminococcus sp.]